MTETSRPRDGQTDPYAPPSAHEPTPGQATPGQATPGQTSGPAAGQGQPPGYGSAPGDGPGYGSAPGYGPATEYGQALPGPPAYGYDPAFGPGPATQLAPQDERTWGVMSHLSVLVSGIVSAFTLGWLGPLLIMLIQGPKSPYVRHHAVEGLNFFISLTIYALISFPLMLVIIGFPMLFAVFVAGIVFPIIASVKANAGEYYRYPLTLRLIK